MSEIVSSQLYRRITRLRWQAPLLAVLLVLVHQIIEHTWLMFLPHWWHFATQALFYGIVGPALAWWALTSLRRSVAETEAAERALKQAHAALSEANERLAFLIRINHRLAEAEDEDDLLSIILELPLEVIPAIGCSYIPFDERQRPLPAIHHGHLEPAVFEAWSSHLADAHIRRQCACCATRRATSTNPCPLMLNLPESMRVSGIYCLKLARGGREYGVLNIYGEDPHRPTAQEESLLRALSQEMSLALESQHLRARELDMLSHLQQAHRRSNLHGELTDVLRHTVEALEAAGGLLVTDTETAALQTQIEAGQPLGSALALVKGMANGARQNESPLIVRDLEQAEHTDVRSLLVAPLRHGGEAKGSLVLWSARPDAFTRRRAQLVNIVAGQTALLLENYHLYLQGEHRATLAERDRLAREIHDGLAQTLGYLKLRTAQIGNWLQNGEQPRAAAGLAEVRELLNEAYVDAREAIDGLHLQARDEDLQSWLSEMVSEFETLSGIQVEADTPPPVGLSMEVQAQLQRIVQEVLSNVRKHAAASQVQMEWRVDGCWLTLRISDNGRGFDVDDVPPIARHGLRIMRERAELLGADFQITSRPAEGTRVVLRLPLPETVDEVKHE